MVIITEIVGGALLGTAFGGLLDAVVYATNKTTSFKSNLRRMEFLLESIIPIMKDIEELNKGLQRPEEETAKLMERLNKGKELVIECAKVRGWQILKKSYYISKLDDLEKSLFAWSILMQAHQSRDLKKNTLEVKDLCMDIRSMNKNIGGERYKLVEVLRVRPKQTIGLDMPFMKLVDRIVKIFPEIDAARLRCSSGLQPLCLLSSAIERAKLLHQYRSESSKLYQAIIGDVLVARSRRTRNLLEQSLGQIQNMVPVQLAVEISQIIDDLRSVTFILDSHEEEAGKVVKELLQQGPTASESMESYEVKALQIAASRLHITSATAILIERRSLKKQLDIVGESKQKKQKILKYFLYLLKKYGNLIMGEMESSIVYGQYEAENGVLSSAIPPEEFKCPISKRVMYDPVVIASGQTFERMWIQIYFDHGNDICPKTKMKLAHLSLSPNTAIKDLISKWCMKYGINIPDPSMQAYHSLETSSTSSIASLGSSMNDLWFPEDIDDILLGPLDISYGSDISLTEIETAISLMLMQTDDDSHKYQPSATINQTALESLTRLAELPWESQCDVVEDVKSRFKCNDQACHYIASENFVESIIRFLRDARDQHDVRAQRGGSQLLLEYVSKNRSGNQYLSEDAVNLLASFLDSEITEEALAIMEVLSGCPYYRSKITAPGTLASIFRFLDSQIRDFQERAIKILHNLSSNRDFCSHIASSECVSKLVPFVNDSTLARHCIIILKNMCVTKEARESVAETNGCLAFVVELLENGSREDQEHAVAVLLSLCSERVQYCQLVLDEGVIPALFYISINGNEKGKVLAMELLRLLRDIQHGDEQKCFGTNLDTSQDAGGLSKEKKSSSKTSGFFGMKFSLFSKPSPLGPTSFRPKIFKPFFLL